MPRRKRRPARGYYCARPGSARIQFFLPVEVADQLVALALAEGKTVSWKAAELVRFGLSEYETGVLTLRPAVDGVRRYQPDLA